LKTLILLFFTTLLLQARENPFFPTDNDKDIPYTTNIKENIPKLKRASIILPSDARVIKSVTIKYQKLDGSIKTQEIELNNRIDWHLPIFITQNYSLTKTKSKKRVVKKESYKEKLNFKKIADLKFIQFYTAKNQLKIITQDNLIRDFLLASPHRLILDFKRKTSFRSYMHKNENAIFKKIKIGNHNGYYRAVIELDGLYKYEPKKIKNGYLFKLY